MIVKLLHQFVGGEPCKCAESEDCNDDDEVTIVDPLFALFHLFLPNPPTPPHLYPNPGTDPTVPMCGLETQMPTITGISSTQIEEGDEFEVMGSGFTDNSQVLIPGARLEVIRRTPERLTVKAGPIATGGLMALSVIEESLARPDNDCRPLTCASTSLGPIAKFEEPVSLAPSGGAVIGTSTQADECSPIVVHLDREMFDPGVPIDVTAHLESPSIAGMTPGGRLTTFQLSPASSFEECVGNLADRLRLELSGGAGLPGDDTCLNCHQRLDNASIAGTHLGMDYLHSLKSAQPDPFPYPCDGSSLGEISFSEHVQPIIDNNCSCHTWLYPDVSYGNLINAASSQSSLVKVKPGEPENSYLWHKLKNTYMTTPDYVCNRPLNVLLRHAQGLQQLAHTAGGLAARCV